MNLQAIALDSTLGIFMKDSRIKNKIYVKLSIIFSFFIFTNSFSTLPLISLKELTKRSSVIISGEIIYFEKRRQEEGINVTTCYIQIRSIIKGNPLTSYFALRKQEVNIVKIKFWDGASLPTGYLTYKFGESGLWFLNKAESGPSNVYQASSRKDLKLKSKVLQILLEH